MARTGNANDGAGGGRGDRHVVVSGATTLEGVDAVSLDAAGAIAVAGDASADRVDVAGSVTVAGSLQAERVDAAGSVTVEGDLRADRVDASGSLEVRGDARIDDLDVGGAADLSHLAAGAVDVAGSLAVETLAADDLCGEGRLVAEHLDVGTLELAAENLDVDTLLAEHVEIEPAGDDAGGLLDRVPGLPQGRDAAERRRVGTLEAHSGSLEEVSVDVLEADRARVGPGSEVRVLRADQYAIENGASVTTVESPRRGR